MFSAVQVESLHKTDRLSIAQVKLKAFISSQIPQTLKGGRSIRESQPAFNLLTLCDLREPIIVHKLKKFVITYKIWRRAQKVAVTPKIWDIYLLCLKRGQCDPGTRVSHFHLNLSEENRWWSKPTYHIESWRSFYISTRHTVGWKHLLYL